MGEKCIVQSVVHYDEGKVIKDGKIVANGKPHLHIMYIPAVPDAVIVYYKGKYIKAEKTYYFK